MAAKWVMWASVGAGLAAVGAAGALALSVRPDAPPQPVPFSHAHHAGELGVDCRFCHWSVETAPHAGMPDMATCAGCHWPVVAAPMPQPLAWRRIRRLPDFAYFDHSRHVNAGVDCATCHGDVAAMERTKPAPQAWTMLWCLDCHRQVDAHQEGAGKLTNCYTCHR